MHHKTPVKAILLDIGNVLLKINWDKPLTHANIPVEKIKEFYSIGHWPIFHDYEKGHISREEFRTKLNSKFKINLTQSEFEKTWCACFDGEVDGVASLLNDIGKKIPLYTLSNTNELHFDFFKDFALFRPFKDLLASHTFHCRKPDELIYKKAINHLKVKAEEILFIDDLEENLETARKLGIKAEHCFQSGLRFREILIMHHLL